MPRMERRILQLWLLHADEQNPSRQTSSEQLAVPAPGAPAVQAKLQQERRGDRNLGKTKQALKWGKDAPHIQQLPLVRPGVPCFM